jgi:hypothetical protein
MNNFIQCEKCGTWTLRVSTTGGDEAAPHHCISKREQILEQRIAELEDELRDMTAACELWRKRAQRHKMSASAEEVCPDCDKLREERDRLYQALVDLPDVNIGFRNRTEVEEWIAWKRRVFNGDGTPIIHPDTPEQGETGGQDERD